MRGALREFVCDSLSGARFAGRGLYRAARVTALLDDHFSGRVDASNKIFALLMLELWYQKFVAPALEGNDRHWGELQDQMKDAIKLGDFLSYNKLIRKHCHNSGT